MGGIGVCCCNCFAERITYTFGHGVVDLGYEWLNTEGTSLGVLNNYFGKTARVCQFTAPLIDCVGSSLKYVDGFWKWLDRTFPFTVGFFPTPTSCFTFDGSQRFQTWLTLINVTVQLARATDGTHHISVGAQVSQTKAKSIWGTATTTSRSGSLCETGETTSTEVAAVPYCRSDTSCTTGVAGTCCFSGGWQTGPWGPAWTTPGVYYDSSLIFATDLNSGWISHSPTMTATVSDTIYEFRQFPPSSTPTECRPPTGVTNTDLGGTSWACGTCNRSEPSYTWGTAETLSLTHRVEVVWRA